MVYTERAETAAVSCGTSYASVASTPLRWIFKTKQKRRYKTLITHVESHASVVSLLERAENGAVSLLERAENSAVSLLERAENSAVSLLERAENGAI